MANVYEGTPDDRQSEEAIAVTRFRPKYRALTYAEVALHNEIKNKSVEMETLIERVKPGRYRSLAMTALE